jgi:4-hydroxy-tetrahydrodipicolinate synthase
MRTEAGDLPSRVGFGGLWVALPTPFRSDGSLDLPAFSALARRVVDGGAQGLVALGSTGEAATLDDEERDRVIDAALAAARGVPVLVGSGSNDTRQAVRLTRRAQASGADGALVVTPYYNKPTPDGLLAHFSAIAQAAADFPLMVYNVPARTGLNLTPDVLARLWGLPTVVALKESSGNLAQIDRIARELPAGKTLLAGDDWIALAAIALGAQGVVSVAGNVATSEMRRLVDAAIADRVSEARRLHRALSPLMEALFLESNPVPLKAALAILGLAGDAVRSPLSRASVETRQRLEGVLAGIREVAA